MNTQDLQRFIGAQPEVMSVWTTGDKGLLVRVESATVEYMRDSEGDTPYLLLKRSN